MHQYSSFSYQLPTTSGGFTDTNPEFRSLDQRAQSVPEHDSWTYDNQIFCDDVQLMASPSHRIDTADFTFFSQDTSNETYSSYQPGVLCPEGDSLTQAVWQEQFSSETDGRLSYSQTQQLSEYPLNPTFSYEFGPSGNEPITPALERRRSFLNDKSFILPEQTQQCRLYEPIPSSSAQAPLLSSWSDAPLNFSGTLQADPLQLPRGWSNPAEPFSLKRIEARSFGSFSSGSGPPAVEESPDTSSLPDLISCSQHQAPGSGSTDKVGSAEPSTPLSNGKILANNAFGHCVSPGPIAQGISSTRRRSLATQAARNRSYSLASGFETASPYPLFFHNTPRYSMSSMVSAISIPSPPQLFATTAIRQTPAFVNPGAAGVSRLLPAITDAELDSAGKEKDDESTSPASQASGGVKPDTPNGKAEKPKRKRMHICSTCGKDFNRPSALLLHSSVHTGERSNFCNVCGRSFSNLSNLRRHQRQLHVLESQMPLPIIPGPQTAFTAYNFGSQTRF